VKRIAGFAVVAAILTAIFAVPASAQQGTPGIEVKENSARVKADGPGFTVKVTKHAIKTHINEERFGIPEAGYPI
jgi:hypothetical protein